MSVAALRRDGNSGKMCVELVERYGKTGDLIPGNLRGIRPVVNVNSVSVRIRTADGRISHLDINTGAKLIEYDGKFLSIYNPGQRDMTQEEKNVMDVWRGIEMESSCYNPYFKKLDFFNHSPFPWLMGSETVRGKRYLYNGKIQDNSIRGELILKYKVSFSDEWKN